MTGEWRNTTLDQLGRIVTGKTPPTADPSNYNGAIPFITPSDMDGRRTISSTSRYLSEAGVSKVASARIPAGAVLVSCIGSDMGKAALAAHESVTNQQINSIVIETDDFPLYVYYNLSVRKDEIRTSASGSAQPILNKTAFGRLPIRLPPSDQQRKIAHTLGTLDDKIELNRRMNATLEAMAWAIFKSWFVDFDPVRAKAEGRQPAELDPATAALFPDGFEDSELGEIPRGWKAAPIGELVRIVGGSTPSTKNPEYWEGGDIHWATPKDLSALPDAVLLDTERKITEAGLAQISSGLLPAGTMLMSSRAPIGYLAITEVPVAINQGFIAMVCDGALSSHYVLRWTESNMEEIKGRANGTTFMEISKANFRPILAVVPPKQLMDVFDRVAGNLHRQIVANLEQSSILSTQRDALLPILLSGEIPIAT